MKTGIYSNLARNSLKNNYRFFIPRVLAEAGLLCCLYISVTLSLDKRLADLRGGDYISTLMWFGTVILSGLSVVLMFYTNSFLMKQRKKEFGIYNILGMEKKHIGRVLFRESIVLCLTSILLGVIFGVLFYKLCSLLICKLLGEKIILGFYFLKSSGIIYTSLFFLLLDIIIYFINRISIAAMKPVELLSSKSAGECEPRVKWIMLMLGLGTLIAGYYISVTTQNPIEVLYLFLIAVILVMIGTYFLFVTGSTFVLKALKKNKKYYYKKNHMTAVSGLLYRMKQNAVGLGSITILATGVLIMISSTVSLYSGMDGSLNKHYPQHLYFTVNYETEYGETGIVEPEKLIDAVYKSAEKNGVKIKSATSDKYLYISYAVEGNHLITPKDDEASLSTVGSICNFIFISNEEYSNLTGNKLNLGRHEIAIVRISSSVTGIKPLKDEIIIHGITYKIKETLSYFPISDPTLISGYTTYGIVMADEADICEEYENQRAALGKYASAYNLRMSVTFENLYKACEVGSQIEKDLWDSIDEIVKSYPDYTGGYSANCNSYWQAKTAFLGMYGSLLFLGILLGTVFLFTTVLIIYYKQISEGYDDRERFQIMQKIGMSKQDVRQTINTQILLVFFLPLVTAGIHFCFAYPMLTRLLDILMLYKPSLFFTCSLITYGIFSLIYVIIYTATSKTYYKIVH